MKISFKLSIFALCLTISFIITLIFNLLGRPLVVGWFLSLPLKTGGTLHLTPLNFTIFFLALLPVLITSILLKLLLGKYWQGQIAVIFGIVYIVTINLFFTVSNLTNVGRTSDTLRTRGLSEGEVMSYARKARANYIRSILPSPTEVLIYPLVSLLSGLNVKYLETKTKAN